MKRFKVADGYFRKVNGRETNRKANVYLIADKFYARDKRTAESEFEPLTGIMAGYVRVNALDGLKSFHQCGSDSHQEAPNQGTVIHMLVENAIVNSAIPYSIKMIGKMTAYANGVQKLSDIIAGRFRHGNIDDPIETRRVWMDLPTFADAKAIYGALGVPLDSGMDFSSEGKPDTLKGLSVSWPFKPEYLQIPDSNGDVFKPGWLNIDPEKLKDIPTLREELLHDSMMNAKYTWFIKMREAIANSSIVITRENYHLLKELENYTYKDKNGKTDKRDTDRYVWLVKTFEKNLCEKLMKASVDLVKVNIAVVGYVRLFKIFISRMPVGLRKYVTHIVNPDQTRGAEWDVLIKLPNYSEVPDWYKILQQCRRRTKQEMYIEDL